MTESLQAFVDASGANVNFRMNLRRIAWLTEIYDAWRSTVPPSEWECGPIVGCERGKGVVRLRHANGAVVEIKTRRT